MQENVICPFLAVVTPMKDREENKKRSSFRFSNKKQLSRARMNRRVPWLIGVSLSNKTKKLTYKDIVACEAIKEYVFEHESTTCKAQPYIVSRCNEEDEEEEDGDKNIRWIKNDTIWKEGTTIWAGNGVKTYK